MIKVTKRKTVVRKSRPPKESGSRPKASGKKTIIKKKGIKKLLLTIQQKKKLIKSLKLVKSTHNPIIEPRAYSWESKATFNPAAFLEDGKVHLIYRAIGDGDVSVLGYASSLNGYTLAERSTHAIYNKLGKFIKSSEPIIYVSGGGWNGGCEDPRVTLIGDTVYMLYTAFDGWGSLRIALTSIKLDDFKKKKWNWEKPILISPPGEIHKNWVLFPEKIPARPNGFGHSGGNGKFAILHSFYPTVLVDYFDNLDELDGKEKFIKSNNTRPIDLNRTWDSWFRGVGPTPVKTRIGWLILYHAMDYKNPDRYRMGALILDFKDPTKILYRSPSPILEPEEYYENNGYKWGVIYSCGAVVKDGRLFVYYGGADKVVGVASIKLEDLIDDLLKNKTTKLKKSKLFEPESQ